MTYEEAMNEKNDLKQKLFEEVRNQIYHESFDKDNIDELAELIFNAGYQVD